MDNDFKKKLASYGALSSAFILAGNHEAEAQATYVDLPDVTYERSQNFLVPDNSTSSWATTGSSQLVVNLDLENGLTNAGAFSTPSADLAFRLRADFSFWNTYSYWSSNSYGTNTWSNNAQASNRLIKGSGNVVGNGSIFNLPAGAVVGPGLPLGFNASYNNLGYVSENFGSIWNTDGNFFAGGSLPSDVTGYLGVRFAIGGQTHYGWVRIRVELDTYTANGVGTNIGSVSRLTILDYAYHNLPNTPLRVGDREGLEEIAIPTMGQWGLIVLNLLLIIFGVQVVQEKRALKLRKRA